MRVSAFPTSSGSRFWRLDDPFKYLRRLGVDARVITEGGITDQVAIESDIVVLQGCVDKAGIALLRAYQQERGLKLVVDCDDYPEVEESNPHLIEHQIADAPFVLRRTIEIADLVTTTTDYLADKLRQINPKVVVLPNYLDLERWDLAKRQNSSEMIRIGWAGSITHLEDLKLLIEPLQRICAEFPQVRLVFVGDLRVKELMPKLPLEAMLGVPFEFWPDKLHGLALDIGLAPLRDSEFNRCKSNIKWLEYSIAAIPGVFSPTVYHRQRLVPKFGLEASTPDEWYGCIRTLIQNPAYRQELAANAYQHIKTRYSLAKHAYRWQQAYQTLLT